MLNRWLIFVLLALMLAATGCASSRNRYGYGQYGRYGSVYDQRGLGVYGQRNRDYRWEQRQRERQREQWRREQRRQQRYQHGDRNWENRNRGR
jgi:hypothetical protein